MITNESGYINALDVHELLDAVARELAPEAALLLPTAANTPSLIATAVAEGFAGSSVVMRPLNRIVSITISVYALLFVLRTLRLCA
jgi:hypothetical protein